MSLTLTQSLPPVSWRVLSSRQLSSVSVSISGEVPEETSDSEFDVDGL